MSGIKWSGERCTGRGCPLAEKCARADPVMSQQHYLVPPYDKRVKGCRAFFHKRHLAGSNSLDKA